MKAITLWQPWASLMALGFKDIETRSWKAPGSLIGGTIAIHAAQKVVPVEEFYAGLEGLNLSQKYSIIQTINQEYGSYDNMPTGAIVAKGILSAVTQSEELRHKISSVERACGDYSDNRYGWVFKDVYALPTPIRVKGQQRIWNWEGDIT